ncbi:MAG: choice-of-anchor V domain-containing protein [Bacteroidota bacterium]|nr:choice-of-anchor V domain-containing protein [Bacteroidota bacterium]
MEKKIYSKKVLKVIFLLALVSISSYTFTNVNGPTGQYTNAPGEGNCTSCHTGSAIASGTAWSAITLSGIPVGGYIPNSTYSVTLAGSTAATSKNGFQITALNSSNTAAGTFTAGTGSSIQTLSGRNYVNHNASGTSLTSFTFNWTAPATAVGSITFYVSFNATNASSTSAGDAIYVKTFSYPVGNLPTAVISPPNGTIVCFGDTLFLQGSGLNNPTSYAWTFLGAGPGEPATSNLQNPKIKYLTAGFKTIRLVTSNASGSSVIAQIVVNIAAKPAATITPSGAQVICGNDSLTLSAPGGTGLTYLWSPGNQTTQTIKVGSAGTFNVKVTNANNCFATSANVTTSVTAKPVISITTSKDTSCTIDSMQITASPAQLYYKYYINNVRVDSTNNNFIKRKLAAGSNEISVISSNGTCNSLPAVKTVITQSQDPAPMLTCDTATSSSVSFLISGSNPQISLDTGKTWHTPNGGASHLLSGLNPNQPIFAQARVATTGECTYSLSSSKTCVANACQPITFKLSFKKNNCLNSDMDSVSSPVIITDLTGNDYYVRFNNSAYSKLFSNNLIVKKGNNNLAISILDSSNVGCGVKDTVAVLVGLNPIASAPVLITGMPVHCTNGDIRFIVSTTPAGANIYKYYKNSDTIPFVTRTLAQGADLPSAPVISYNFNSGDMVKLIAIDTVYGCMKSSNTQILNIVKPANAGFTFIKENLKIEVQDTGSNSISRTWNFGNGTIINTAPKIQTNTYATAGNYKVSLKIVDGFGCFNSDTQTVNIVATGVSQNLLGSGQMRAYPNPASEILTLSWNKNLGNEANLIVLDIQGKVVKNLIVGNDETISLSALSRGTYLLKLIVNNNLGWQKLLIE